MDNTGFRKQAKLVDRRQYERLSVYGDAASSGACESHDYKQNYRDKKRYGKYFHLLTVGVLSLLANPSLAGDVGGVSATANPIANSSGSVTNQAIQVLQGPYITNTYGNGIQCQGPTLNVTPFMTRTGSFQLPYEDYYNDPVYDTSDLNDDGVIDNPGKILYHRPIRTGQKSNYSWNGGLSATLSIPLDGGLQARCKRAAEAQIALQEQMLANRRLDFEIARLKNCGELAKAGITFRPGSQFAKVCADIVVKMPNETVAPHVHPISLTPAVTHEEHDSDHAGQDVSLEVIPFSGASHATQKSSSLPSSQQVSPALEASRQAALLGGPLRSRQQQ